MSGLKGAATGMGQVIAFLFVLALLIALPLAFDWGKGWFGFVLQGIGALIWWQLVEWIHNYKRPNKT